MRRREEKFYTAWIKYNEKKYSSLQNHEELQKNYENISSRTTVIESTMIKKITRRNLSLQQQKTISPLDKMLHEESNENRRA